MWMGSTLREHAFALVLLPVSVVLAAPAIAQAPAAAPAASRQLGTVKAISGNSVTLAVDGGAQVTASVADNARILQLAPGSTDLKSAQPITLGDIAVGDRLLIIGKSGDDGSFTALRVILMKSTDIAQKNQADMADWQRRGVGGIVTAVSGGNLTISSGSKKIAIETSGSTKFRRYAAGSVKFEDARPGTIDDLHTGDQLRVRGAKSDDGLTIKAEEIVSGAFRNLAGTLATVNAGAGTVTLKDLSSKKTVTVAITSSSDLRKLPPEMAARFAARAAASRGAASGAGAAPAGERRAPTEGQASPAGEGRGPAGPGGAAGGPGGPGGAGRPGGGDLSQMLPHLPTESLAELKVGEAVMIVASDNGNSALTAVTVLSGVESILAASPNGSPEMTLSPWSMGGGSAEAGSSPQ